MPVVTEVVPDFYQLSLGPVNAYILASPEGSALIDTGLPGSADTIVAAVRELAPQLAHIRHIILTHAHPDHIGSFAELKALTRAEAYMHAADAPIARSGKGFRPMRPAPGLLRRVMFRLFVRPVASVHGAPVEHELKGGEELAVAGGLRVIHVPGHCAGQVALLWPQHGGVMIAADACSNIPTLGLSLGYEDLEQGKRSLGKLAMLNFEVACFGHGKPIRNQASAQFRKHWG